MRRINQNRAINSLEFIILSNLYTVEHFQKVINKDLARNTKPKPENSKGCDKHCSNNLHIKKEGQAREILQINLRRNF